MARPDPFIPKFPNDIIRSGDWNEIQVRSREELRGHKHTGGSDGAPIPRAGIQPNAIDGTRIDPKSSVQLASLEVGNSLKVQGRELAAEITTLLNRATELEGRLKAQEAKAVELTNRANGVDSRLNALDAQKLDRAGGTVTGDLSVQKSLRATALGLGSAQATLPARLSLGTDVNNTKVALHDNPSDLYGFGIQGGQFRLHLGNPGARFSFLDSAAGKEVMTIKGEGSVGIGTTNPQQKLHVVGGGMRVDADIQYSGQLSKLDVAEHSSVTIRALDLRFGHSGRRGTRVPNSPPGRALVDYTDTLVLNYGSDWPKTTIGGRDLLTLDSNITYVPKRLGVGTNGPEAPLHVSSATDLAVRLTTSGNRVVQQFERKGKLLWDIGVGTGDAANEDFWFGDFQAYRLLIKRNTGDVELPTGRLISKSKFFRIDHPLDPERKYLDHCSLEGPESAVYYRGEARLLDGVATVVLPDYFEALVRPEDRTVQLTPKLEGREPVSLLAASAVEGGRFTVRAIDPHNPSQAFYWEVKAVRGDIERLRVEHPKPEKAVRPTDAGSP